MKQKEPGRRHKSFWIVLVIINLSAVLFMGEIIARLLEPFYKIPNPPPSRTIDPYGANPFIIYMRPYIYSHIPNASYIQSRSYYAVHYRINSLGFRGPEIKEKSKTIKRLLCIGDSFTEGHGNAIEDTFVYHLDQKLHNDGWEAINVGVQGASPIYYAFNLDRYLSLEPDMVLLFLSANDLQEDRVREAHYFELPYLVRERILFDHRGSVLDRSKLYLTIKYLIKNRVLCLSSLEKIVMNHQKTFIQDADQKMINKISPYLVTSSMFDKQWSMSRVYLDYVVRRLEERGVSVIIAYGAYDFLNPEKNSAFRKHAFMLDKKLSAWAKYTAISYLSILPAVNAFLEEGGDINELVIRDDGHLTKKGNQLVEKELLEMLLYEINKKS